jgi:predicted anti-sigma-YlaC factor YlaD
MDCDSARVALSARIDGEDPALPGEDLDAHLATCAECRAWQQRAHAVTRRTRLGGAFLDHDLTGAVLAAVPVTSTRRWRQLVPRGALVVLALSQLAIAVPMLLGHDHDAGMHAAHELGSFNLALAIAFAVGALRPRLSAGLAWPCGIAAAGLIVTALADLAGGETIGADEAAHLVALAGAALLAWQARPGAIPVAGPAAGADTERGDLKTAEEDVASTGWAVARTRPGHGGDAARLATPHHTGSPGAAAGTIAAGAAEPAAGRAAGSESGRADDAPGHRDESVA